MSGVQSIYPSDTAGERKQMLDVNVAFAVPLDFPSVKLRKAA